MSRNLRPELGGTSRGVAAHEITSIDLEDVLQQSAAVAADACHVPRVAVFLLAEESQMLQCVAMHPERRDVQAIALDADSLVSRVVRLNRLEVNSDPATFSSPDLDLLRGVAVRSALGLPIVIGGRCLGGLVLLSPLEAHFSREQIERGARVARNIAVAVEKANLYQEATQRIAELSLLHEVGRAFNESLELSEILDTCADQLAALVDASKCFILLCEPDGLRCVASSGDAPNRDLAEGVLLRHDEPSLAALALRERRAIVSVDATEDARANQRMVARFGQKSLLAIPMIHRGRPVGAVIFDDQQARRRFMPAEIERISLVASHLAAALDNARLYEDLRRSYAELADAQARLVQRERLAALGELAAQVAHEVRNPLGVVFNAVGELRRRLGTDGETGYLLGVLSDEAERINRIVGDLIDFARPLDLSLQVGTLPATFEDAIASALRFPGIRVERDLDANLDEVAFDARLLRQALLNLFQNAVQAMHGAGTVRVHAHVVHLEGRTWAEIAVEDSGPGVEASMRERIFEPFFTTKAAGIGLGLAVVKRIAEAHQGQISVTAGGLGGACFRLRWPVQPGGFS